MKKSLLILAVAAMGLSSCYCDKMTVGSVQPNEDLVHVASIHHNHFIGGAVVMKNNTKSFVPNVENYVIENKMTIGDILVSGLTGGIYTPTTTKFYVPASNPKVVKEKQKFKSKAYKGYLKD